MAPPGDLHGAVELSIAAQLKSQGDLRGFGKARSGAVGIILWRNPDRVVGADAVFIANASLPIRRSPEGYLETVPDLVVEVVSKNDARPYVSQKVSDYLSAGVKVVWVADPPSRTVTEYRPSAELVTYHAEDVLTLEDLIPGFQMQVAEAFEE
jgi:Uma2 family endonuclease